jgi:hypothetical protein
MRQLPVAGRKSTVPPLTTHSAGVSDTRLAAGCPAELSSRTLLEVAALGTDCSTGAVLGLGLGAGLGLGVGDGLGVGLGVGAMTGGAT